MKTTVLSFMLCACVSQLVRAQDSRAQLTDIYQHSAISLFNQLSQFEDDNICFSPLSLQIALSMVQNGAAGNTLSQLQRALGTEGFSNEEIGEFNNTLAKALTERPPYNEQDFQEYNESDPREVYDGFYPICQLANSLWTRPDVQLYDDFVQALRTDYDASVEAVHFDTWEGIEKINAWASEKTHGLIPRIYDTPQTSDLAVMLANALYFKGGWTVPFFKGDTSKGQFLLDDDTYATVDMMSAHDRFNCALTPNFQTITLYYGVCWDFSMTLFVPREGTALPPLTFDDWSSAQKITNLHINLYMPRFEIFGKYDLKEMLKVLGVTDAFDPEKTDFTKMSEVNRGISRIAQFSKLQVDEKGTEAAAVTIIEEPTGLDLTDPEDYQDFLVDRPFYFTIQSQKNKSILFIGRVKKLDGPRGQVVDPTAIHDLSAPEMVNGASSAGQWYDHSGRRLSVSPASSVPSVLPKGVYIKDGKKVMVK